MSRRADWRSVIRRRTAQYAEFIIGPARGWTLWLLRALPPPASSRPNAGGVHAPYRGNGYSGSGRRAGTGGRIAEPQGRLMGSQTELREPQRGESGDSA